MKVNIPSAPAELVDKITILEIKASRVKDKQKLVAVIRELTALHKLFEAVSSKSGKAKKELLALKTKLSKVNLRLWRIEDKIRKMEDEKQFNNMFIQLARMVYVNNDERSRLKGKINVLLGADFGEVKEYTKYKV
jgi:predicted  nucleic acid-binding Zn-ribbon protein